MQTIMTAQPTHLFTKDVAETMAARIRADDPDWQYIVQESPITGYVVAIYDEIGEFLGYL